MSNALEIGKKLVSFCKAGQNLEAVEALYADDIVSIEPVAMGDMPARAEGIEAIKSKNTWWSANHEVHSAEVKGPFPHGSDRFACFFSYDVTNKPSGQRIQMEEVALFAVKDGKITQEEFFYTMG